ncbi:MAG: hypothetical protein K8S54_11750 [Spirochaetia bacterium]|nr:hypothetical protein [Spirochaetia bacterium]
MRTTTLALCFVSQLVISGLEAQKRTLPSAPPADWKVTYQWLQQNYNYPDSGPNYDWPSTEKPKVVSDTIMAIDGTVIPILPGASEVNLSTGKHSVVSGAFQATTIKYEVKTTNRAMLAESYKKLSTIFRDTYHANLESFARTSPSDYIIVRGIQDGLECELLIPGKVSTGKMEFADGGTMSVEYTVRGISHFYFFRTNLLVVKDQVTLSDGTAIPLFPGKQITEVNVGNTQGTAQPETHVDYSFYVPDHAQYPAEFVKLYTMYSKRFGFPVSAYRVWDQGLEDFKIRYEDEKVIVTISVGGDPVQKGLQTSISRFPWNDKLLSLSAELDFKNKTQMIPGQNAELPKPPEKETEKRKRQDRKR